MLNLAQKIGFEKKASDKHSDGQLRQLVWGKLGGVGYEEMLKYSKEKFDLMLADPEVKGIDPDMQGNILSTVAKNSENIEPLIKLHSAFKMEEEKRRCERAIGSVSKQAAIEQAINFAFRYLFYHLSQNRTSKPFAQFFVHLTAPG